VRASAASADVKEVATVSGNEPFTMMAEWPVRQGDVAAARPPAL
jgi:vacuolar-type H+-ATPase catalytic subunit A/Vma1